MAALNRYAPLYAYVYAVTFGAFYTWVWLIIANAVSLYFDRWSRGLSFPGALTLVAAHVLLGGFFGLLWPERSWRWGVWLCLAQVGLVSLTGRDVFVFCWGVALTMVPACAGAYVAARVHLKYVESE